MSRLHNWRQMAASTALLCSISCITFTCNAYAATPEPPGLFSPAPGNSRAELPEKAIKGRSRAVKINHGRLRSGQFFVSLPGDVSLEAVRDRRKDHGNGRFAWVGHAGDSPEDRVVIGVSGDSVAGTFAYKGKLYKLEPRASGEHILSEVSPGDPAPELDPIPVADTTGSGSAGTGGATSPDGGPIIDVLVAYTPRIQSIYGTQGAEALIIQAVAETNQAYANSGINTQLNLVHSVLTNYTESGDMSTDLSRLRSTNDGYMDELHTLRNNHGADLVSLIEDESQYCGIAYRMTSLSSGFASSGFSVVHRTCATGYYSFAHELGHNQGAHHNPANASGAIYPYAYGHQNPYGAFRTVMAYNCSGGCTRVDHFSNPDVLYNGEPTGTQNAEDNALTINNTAATVAGFRQQQTQNPPNTPSGLAATATSHSEIQLSWTDTAADESGFTVERSSNGVNFSEVASLPANSNGYLDNSLQADTLYTYRTRAWNSAGNSGYSNSAVAATQSAPPMTDQKATADLPVAGSVTGTYQRTWSDDGTTQTIRERESGGKKNRRYGYLEHKWTFQVQPGNAIFLFADAQTSAGSDSFTFAYSTDNAQYINMFTIDNGSSGARQFTLPPALSGTVYVRVKDTVRNRGEVTSHTVQVDYLMIRSENGAALPPPSAPSDLAASPGGSDRIALNWTDTADSEYGFAVERSMDGSSNWTEVGTTGANNSAYQDTGLGAGTLYHYRVAAFNGSGQSSYSNGASAQTDEQAVANIDLSANGYKVKGKQKADLSWSGAQGTAVDIYRDGSRIASSVSNDGAYTDAINRKGGGSYVYEVCEAGSNTCSNTVTVAF